jgi:hypothetical protein
MRFKAMRAAAVFAATIAASCAYAQNSDSDDYRAGYRSGYDDGFQRGYEKGLRESGAQAPAQVVAPPPSAPPRSTGPIAISRAVYGNGSHVCDASRWAARMANGRAMATLDASNEICGDPAKGERKSRDVTYVCGSIAKSATAYEHRSLSLDCTP